MARSIILCLLATIAIAVADPMHDGLVVKWSPNPFDGESFWDIPRTRAEAEAGTGEDAWLFMDEGSDEPYDVFCQLDNERFCPIYDSNGFIAGVQIGLAVEDMANNNFAYPHESNVLYSRKTRFGRDNWVGTALFISPTLLASGGRSDLSQGTMQELWLQYGQTYTDARKIPLDPATLLSDTLFTLQNCLPTMGIHYYYNISPELACEEFDPWFLTYKGDQIVGIGFQNFGNARLRPNTRLYSEDVPLSAINFVIPNAPACLLEWVEADHTLSLHMFFVSHTSTITC